MSSIKIKQELKKISQPEKIKVLSSFFKTRIGQYGEGDLFIGVTVPNQRKIAKKFINIELKELDSLISSKTHEHRLTAFIILAYKYEKADQKNKKDIYTYYLKNRKYANNWDIVDVTTPKVVGEYLYHNPENKEILYKYAHSKNLWEKRMSILATYTFIRNNQFEDTLKISEILLNDNHDLIHKAVGWMLREVGNRDLKTEEKFLKNHYKKMPRTMLRYAIEKFKETQRQKYLNNKI